MVVYFARSGVESCLDGVAWIMRVFDPATNLAMPSQTGLEIRMLVQSFLNARTKALPPAQPHPASTDAMNPESQEEYERLRFELDDAELLAALGEGPVAPAIDILQAQDDASCKRRKLFLSYLPHWAEKWTSAGPGQVYNSCWVSLSV
ncbi:hypothetical protein BKA83DRAFT_3461144 [Pisolithus microcarpus]|nr:hypothetical protein BKA83DRAFT_3461144 [Pisolithus microcarpus]